MPSLVWLKLSSQLEFFWLIIFSYQHSYLIFSSAISAYLIFLAVAWMLSTFGVCSCYKWHIVYQSFLDHIYSFSLILWHFIGSYLWLITSNYKDYSSFIISDQLFYIHLYTVSIMLYLWIEASDIDDWYMDLKLKI